MIRATLLIFLHGIFFSFFVIDFHVKQKKKSKIINLHDLTNYIYRFTTFVCDGGFGGWGKREVGEAAGDFFS